jgi:hypothetical protein
MTVSGAWSLYRRTRPPTSPRLGGWQQVLADALDQNLATGVRAAVADHLGRTPTRAELTPTRRAAHSLAALGCARALHVPGADGDADAGDRASRAGGYGRFDVATYFLHDVDPDVAAEGEPYQRSEADIVFGSVCDFEAWPAIGIRVLAGDDDRFFPVGLQRRISRDRLGVEADVLPGGR